MLEQKKNAQHATIVLVSAEQPVIMLAEAQSYPLSACISDTGGAAGLFLGLNVIGRSQNIFRSDHSQKQPLLKNLSCFTFKYLIFFLYKLKNAKFVLSQMRSQFDKIKGINCLKSSLSKFLHDY